jgi:hypothetical protein
MKTKTLLLLLTLIAASAFAANPDAPPPELKRLAMLANDFTAVLEQRDRKTEEWSSRVVEVSGREILAGRFIENRTRIQFTGEPRPSEVHIIWSYNVFNKRYRMAVLDDLVGMLDVFEQFSDEPLSVTNAFGNRVTVRPLDGGKVRLEADRTSDGGKTWTEVMRLTLTPK